MAAKDVVEADLVQRDAEVEQLCAEVEDREARIDELKLMLKKMLESSANPAAPAGAAAKEKLPERATRAKPLGRNNR